ncbi:hypothetical protein Gotur_009290 [Gossypium turneri]
MGRITQMLMTSSLQPSLEYIQWYSSCRKPYPMKAEPATDHDPELEPEPEPEQSHSHGDSHCYHPDSAGNDYFPSLSGGEYAYEFDIFGSYPPQYSTPGPYPQHHRTPSGSSSLMPIEPHDFSSMFSTPLSAPNEDVGHREHP